MKLQLALDDITLDAALTLLMQISNSVDIIEAGTPFVLEYGMEAIRTLRAHFPTKEILCDAKIMDGGALEAHAAFNAGADYVTVLGVADKATLKAVIEAANARGRHAVVDLLCVEHFAQSIPALEALGAKLLAVHVGVDQQRSGRTPLQDLIAIQSVAKTAQVFVAGGVNAQTLSGYIAQRPAVIIVGGAIMRAANPAAEAQSMYRRIQEAN